MDLQNYRGIRQFEAAVEVAKLYYIKNMSQQQIADRMGMSRSNVSRILTGCQKDGIVEIRVNEAGMRLFELKKRLRERFGLKELVIVPHSAGAGSVLDGVCKAAAGYVQECLSDGMVVGLGWGETVRRLISALKPGAYLGVEVVQLLGGVSMSETLTDGVQLTLDFSRKTGAAPHLLNAPMVVSSKQARDIFIEENSVKQRLERAESIDMAILTVGTNEPEKSALVAAGYISREESQALCNRGLCTHVLGQHIDGLGNPGAEEFNDRVVGIGLEAFKRIPLRICVAAGAFKARQVAAALAGGYVNALVIDEMTALKAEKISAESN